MVDRQEGENLNNKKGEGRGKGGSMHLGRDPFQEPSRPIAQRTVRRYGTGDRGGRAGHIRGGKKSRIKGEGKRG